MMVTVANMQKNNMKTSSARQSQSDFISCHFQKDSFVSYLHMLSGEYILNYPISARVIVFYLWCTYKSFVLVQADIFEISGHAGFLCWNLCLYLC